MDTVVQPTADPAIIAELNDLVDQRLTLEARRASIVRQHQAEEAALKQSYTALLSEVEGEIKPLDTSIWEFIQKHRGVLISPTKQSFATMVAKFQFRKTTGKDKVTDADGLLDIARKLGVVRKVADPPTGKWRVNRDSFFGWLEKNDGLRSLFAGVIEHTDDNEGLTIQPNATHTVMHDLERITPPSVSIERPSSVTPAS